jgi:hypothetical protein
MSEDISPTSNLRIFLGPIEQLDIRGPRRQPFGSRSSSAERVERLAGVANKFRGVQV